MKMTFSAIIHPKKIWPVEAFLPGGVIIGEKRKNLFHNPETAGGITGGEHHRLRGNFLEEANFYPL